MAGANRIHSPRRGSLQFWPRVRAKKVVPRVRNWPKSKAVKLQGFVGYKVGMTHLMLRDNKPTSITKGEEIFLPVTVIECPPMKVSCLRFYKHTSIGLQLIHDTSSKKTQEPKEFDEVRAVALTQPNLTGFGKKNSDMLEIALSGENKEDMLKISKDLIGKVVKVSDVFKDGQFLDSHGVTTGKGFQGVVKRYGIPIRHHKAEKTKRGIGTLGPWVPSKVSWRVAQNGKMGFHTRTEYNKWLVKISNDASKINPRGGFISYGLVKNDYILVKGSIQGPIKRAIVLTDPIRGFFKKPLVPEITYTSLESKQ